MKHLANLLVLAVPTLVLLISSFMIVSCSKIAQNWTMELVPQNESCLTKSTNRTQPHLLYENMPPSSGQVLDTLKNGIVVERIDSMYIFQGDIIFYPSTIGILDPLNSKSAAVSSASYYWPDRKVYFSFDSSFNSSLQGLAMEAMNTISSVCGVVFVPALPTSSHYILFKYDASSNKSEVGMSDGQQIIFICTYNKGTIMHELMHALGFFHEHCRTDRDNYIIVNWNNIELNQQHNFQKYEMGSIPGYDIGTFDFNSIMMYPGITSDSNVARDTSLPIMTKINSAVFDCQRDSLSIGDIAGLRSVYGPPFHRLETTTDLVIQEEDSYYRELYVVQKTSTIKFYSSPECIERMNTQYPRKIQLRVIHSDCDSYNDFSRYSTTYDITVPAGVDSVFIDTYVNYEDYLFSNPNYVHTIEYSIVNSHVVPLSQ